MWDRLQRVTATFDWPDAQGAVDKLDEEVGELKEAIAAGDRDAVERAYRDIRGLCVGAGTIEAQLNFIGTNVARGRTTTSPGWIPQRFT